MAVGRYRKNKKGAAARLRAEKRNGTDVHRYLMGRGAQKRKKKEEPGVTQDFAKAAQTETPPSWPAYGTDEHDKFFIKHGSAYSGIVQTGAGESEMRTLPNYMVVIRDEDGDILSITPPSMRGPLVLDTQEKVDASIPVKTVGADGSITYTSAYGTVIDRPNGWSSVKDREGNFIWGELHDAPSAERTASTVQPREKAKRKQPDTRVTTHSFNASATLVSAVVTPKKEMSEAERGAKIGAGAGKAAKASTQKTEKMMREKREAEERKAARENETPLDRSLRTLAVIFAATAEYTGRTPEEIISMVTGAMSNKPSPHVDAAVKARQDREDRARGRTTTRETKETTRDARATPARDAEKPVSDDEGMKVGDTRRYSGDMFVKRTKDGWLFYNPDAPDLRDRDKEKSAQPGDKQPLSGRPEATDINFQTAPIDEVEKMLQQDTDYALEHMERQRQMDRGRLIPPVEMPNLTEVPQGPRTLNI